MLLSLPELCKHSLRAGRHAAAAHPLQQRQRQLRVRGGGARVQQAVVVRAAGRVPRRLHPVEQCQCRVPLPAVAAAMMVLASEALVLQSSGVSAAPSEHVTVKSLLLCGQAPAR
jgi:hypothetical protein